MALTDPIVATYVSASSFSVASDKAAEFVTGVRVQADCGADGIKYGTVTSTGTATVVLTLDSGSLTSNLVGVWHGNDIPLALCSHKSIHATGGRDAIAPSDIGAIPATTGAATAYVDAATTSAAGKVQLATTAEATAGTDTAKVITPAALAAALLAAIGIDPIDLPRNSDLGTAAYLDQTWLYASATWDAPSVATAAQTSTTVAVPGAEIGDKVFPSVSIALSGLNLRGEVTASDTVTLYLSNLTGDAIDLASATYYVAVLKLTPAR